MAIDKGKLQEEASMIRFCKILLGWDYAQIVEEAKNRDKKKDKSGLKKVKDTYKDVDDYLATFEPLLFEEVKAHIAQNKENEDEVQEWKLRLVMECGEADGFHFPGVSYIADEEESISQNDLLLLSNEEFADSSSKSPPVYAFALVEHRSRSLLRLRMYLVEETVNISKNTVQPSKRLSNMRALVTSSSSATEKTIFSLKICSLSTITREYVALRSLGALPFKDLVLTGAGGKSCSADQSWSISAPLQRYFKENLNISQKEAIDAGLSRNSFVLIQGPPGTGKTQTILGLLSAILHATPSRLQSKGGIREVTRGPEMPFEEKYNHWGLASPWLYGINPRDSIMPLDGDDGFFPTSGNDMKPEVVNSHRKYRVRVLVCAPSNSALDEIVSRILRTGLRDENVRTYTPKIVRIGLKAHHSVASVSLDHLVAQRRGSAANKQKQGATGMDVDSIRSAILDEAAVVFSTLSFSGSALLSKSNCAFDVVIIDEAAQAVEAATLVPLTNGCKQVFLVGDPVQLPATVISPIAERSGYGTSMFKRLQKAGYPVNMLKTQYRMHPEIRSFPSKEFYDEALEDGPSVEVQTNRDWHKYRCFAPFCFFDIYQGQESQPSGSGSLVNLDEIDFVLLMYHKLVSLYPQLKSSSQIAIITPYSYQVKSLKERFRDTFGVEADKVVDIGTIDGFQGREKDVTIFTCVRANKNKSIGFVSDFRRMNVGITRAKSSVLVVGSADTLTNDEHWKNLIQSAEKKERLFKVPKPYTSYFTDQNLESMKVKEEIPDQGPVEDETTAHYAHIAAAEIDHDMEAGDGDGENFEGGED